MIKISIFATFQQPDFDVELPYTLICFIWKLLNKNYLKLSHVKL